MSAIQQKIEQARAVRDAFRAGKKPDAAQTPAPAPRTADVIQIQPDAPSAPITAAAQLAELKQAADKDRDDAAAESLTEAIEAENREFFVSIEGGKAGVFREGIDPEMGHRVIVGMTQSEYRLMRANRMVQVTDGNGNTKAVCIADAWIRSPARREYPNGFALLPGQDAPEGVYNLWRGWGIEPKEGDVKPALKHLRNVICSGDDKVFRYKLGWLAHCVQKPGDPPSGSR